MTRLELQRVEHMPAELQAGVLYVSERFSTAAHLCACGCGSKVRTPLGPTEWTVWATPDGPSVRPSIGNWQRPCRSHYVIDRGRILWAGEWTAAEIEAGRRQESARREAYFARRARGGFWVRLWRALRRLLAG